jgi:hypothetical protein
MDYAKEHALQLILLGHSKRNEGAYGQLGTDVGTV